MPALDGAALGTAPGLTAELTVQRAATTPERPHGASHPLVLRSKMREPLWVRFDSAHPVPDGFAIAAQFFGDLWREVNRTLDEKGIPEDP